MAAKSNKHWSECQSQSCELQIFTCQLHRLPNKIVQNTLKLCFFLRLPKISCLFSTESGDSVQVFASYNGNG